MSGYESLRSVDFWNTKVNVGRHFGQPVRAVEASPVRVRQRNCELHALRLVLEDGSELHVVTKDTCLHRSRFKDDVHYERTKRAYEVEITFYEELSAKLSGSDAITPEFYYAAAQGAEFLLVLEDLSRKCKNSSVLCERACQKVELDERDAKRALQWLAAFHATFVGREGPGAPVWPRGAYWSFEKRQSEWRSMEAEWQQTCQNFEWRYPTTFSRESVQALATRLAEIAEELDAALEPVGDFQTLLHGDFKTANLFFLTQGVAACDFQWTGPGLGAVDVIYLLFSSVQSSVVFTRERDLLFYYYQQFLQRCAERGVHAESLYPWELFKAHAEMAFLDYVRFSIGSLWGSITPKSHEDLRSHINLGMHRRNPDYLVQMVRKADELLTVYSKRGRTMAVEKRNLHPSGRATLGFEGRSRHLGQSRDCFYCQDRLRVSDWFSFGRGFSSRNEARDWSLVAQIRAPQIRYPCDVGTALDCLGLNGRSAAASRQIVENSNTCIATKLYRSRFHGSQVRLMLRLGWTLFFLVVLPLVRCAIPEDLSNFHNEHVCDQRVRLVRPSDVKDVIEAVQRHSKVVAVGTGQSTVKEFFCPPPPNATYYDLPETTAVIALTAIRPLVINVDEEELTAWVSAGVIVYDLITYLANYVTPCSPKGYALASVSTWVNQTMAGAVATGTHGSSLRYGSFSNQVAGFRVVLANGTLTEIYPDAHPLLFRAFQLSVGRLGVITDVKMRIIRETLIERTLHVNVTYNELIPRLRTVQEQYKTTGTVPSWIEHRFFFLYTPVENGTFVVSNLEEVAEEPNLPEECEASTFLDLDIATQAFLLDLDMDEINTHFQLGRYDRGLSIADGVSWELPTPLEPNPFYADPASLNVVAAGVVDAVLANINNATGETGDITPITAEAVVDNSRVTMHDEYEVAFPFEKLADCLEGVIELVQALKPDHGLRTILAVRLAAQENGLLSYANDKPRAWIGLQDYVYYHQEPRGSNLPFKRIIAYLVESEACSPVRLHFGKGGWPDQGCWNGAEVYPDTWCHFGCVVKELDPHDKFIGLASGVWNWNGANLEECCTANGYDDTKEGCGCDVQPLLSPEDCPDAPFYTNR